MTCIKTGCHIFIEAYGEYAYGDAHQFGSAFVFRLVARSFHPLSDSLHFRVKTVEHWFDQGAKAPDNSTLITLAADNLGYDGEPI